MYCPQCLKNNRKIYMESWEDKSLGLDKFVCTVCGYIEPNIHPSDMGAFKE